MDQEISIKYVAKYLRKSRGESDSDLDNHRLILDEVCSKYNWSSPVEYTEIETGDSITMRPVMQRLLNDITNGVYDAVCVVDIDRLGRGDMGDQDVIKKAFARSNTYIVTPQHVYNLENENDEFAIDMKSFIARQEYKQIVKRLTQGKKVGARRGHWTNGTPPFPYQYERWNDSYNPKGLVVNKTNLPIYRLMVEMTVNKNMSPKDIAVEINKMGISSPRGGKWSGLIVYRLMLNETHLGWIVSNKTSGDGHARKKENAKSVKRIPRDMWSIVKDCHEAVKTPAEHEAIKLFYSRLPSVSKRKPNQILTFTGLIKCGICGRTMGTHVRYNNRENIKPCWYTSPDGEKCHNSGGVINDEIFMLIRSRIERQRDKLIQSLSTGLSQSAIDVLKRQINIIEQTIKAKEKAFEKATEAYEAGVYSLAQLIEKKEKRDSAIAALVEQRDILAAQIERHTADRTREKIMKYDEYLSMHDSDTDPKRKNAALKDIIGRIIWTRQNNHIDMEIEFN